MNSQPKNQDATNPASTSENHHEDGAEADVVKMVEQISLTLDSAIGEIYSVNSKTKLLSLNARIEAARSGAAGAAFGVVAEEMQTLSAQTQIIAAGMSNRTREETAVLMGLIDSTIRGTRLRDLALVNIDLIDRNLYERTCDVRWWATDGSLVQALENGSEEDCAFASRRMGVILSAYTVYHDLVLCDPSGRVIANGRPDLFTSQGSDESSAPWFRQSMSSRSGDDWGFQTAHRSTLVGNEEVLVYSAAVRQGGEATGQAIGVLGILFNWPGLASPILENVPVLESERAVTEAFIVDRDGVILAARCGSRLGEKLNFPGVERVFESEKGFFISESTDKRLCVGHAKAPGFETYSTEWYSIVTQPVRR